MKKWVFSDDAWRRQLRELERRLTKSDLKRNPNQILFPHTITLQVKYNKKIRNTARTSSGSSGLIKSQGSEAIFKEFDTQPTDFRQLPGWKVLCTKMSWPVQIKEVFDVLQSSLDSILDPTDPEIKMHLLAKLVNSAFWTWQQIKKPDLTQKNFDWPIWEPCRLKVLPPFF